MLLAVLAASPSHADASSRHAAAAHAHPRAVYHRQSLRRALFPCQGTLFRSNAHQSNDDEVTVAHQRVRRRALKRDTFRLEPVLVQVAVLRDYSGGASRFSALHPVGLSPPSL